MMTRREVLSRIGSGFGMLGLSGMLGAKERAHSPLEVKPSHFAPKAKRVIFLFLNGGPSQVDTFDPKPMLTKYHGQPMPTPNLRTERKTGTCSSRHSSSRNSASAERRSARFSPTSANAPTISA